MNSPLPGTPLTWSPHGASDSLDGSTSFPGAMSSLQNLIPDPSTQDLWQCRPAALLLNSFAGFSSPAFVSCRLVVGTFMYGMVSTSRNAGKDEPFAYNIVSNTFTTISGVTSASSPVSPATTGAWTPPHMELIGTKIICTHPGFPGGGLNFGVLDITNPATPTWTATNTTTNALPAVPVWVSNFNGRAYYLVNPSGQQPAAYISNIGDPITCNGSGNNFTPILTFGDNVALTCAAGLPLENQLGGIIQSLMIFKGVTNIFQITGDPYLPVATGVVTSNLAINSLNVATGTFAPNSVCASTKGIMFMAPDGVRVIDFEARVSDPLGKAGAGITLPFFNAGTPSRSCASFNAGVYRIQVTNTNTGAASPPSQQWWYDFVRDVWSGPHTQQMSLIAPYINTFLVTLQNGDAFSSGFSPGFGSANSAAIYQSDQVQSSTSGFIESGLPLTYNFTTTMLPDTDQMAEVCVIETTVYMALSSVSGTITAYAYDQNGAVLAGPITIFSAGSGTIWGAFKWGQANWGGTASGALYPRQIAWTQPLVFRRMQLSVQGTSSTGIKIGRTHLRYQVLGYLQQ